MTAQSINSRETKKLKQNLRQVFGLEKLRPAQAEVMRHVLNGADVLAIMPTGAGKSLCYQLPALQLEGMTIVVSPLISLMKDQSDKLAEKGLEVANLNSSVSTADERAAIETIERENADFVFTTPERLVDAEFLASLKDKTIDFVVIDEAHCISHWGHDFRPAFLEIRRALAELKNPPILALTATATPEVIEDIKKQLDRPEMQLVNTGIFRPNLKFEVVHVTNDAEKRANLVRVLRDTAGSKIVYCATVKAVEAVTDFLQKLDFSVGCYHGKLSSKKRHETQDEFMRGAIEIIVATNAFGMGVDKPDIRAVIHWQIAGSLESYYQEAGRAGRDHAAARCVLLFDVRDKRTQQFFLGGKYPSADDVLTVYQALERLEKPSLSEVQETVGDAVAKTKTRVALNLLKDAKILKERRGARFQLIKNDLNDARIQATAEEYESRGAIDREKLEQMMFYAQTAFCRWRVLAKYFECEGETAENCGICDNCANPVTERLGIATASEKPVTKTEEILAELRANPAPVIEAGEIVRLPKHGAGEVKTVAGDKITVAFADGETKTFKSEFVTRAAE